MKKRIWKMSTIISKVAFMEFQPHWVEGDSKRFCLGCGLQKRSMSERIWRLGVFWRWRKFQRDIRKSSDTSFGERLTDSLYATVICLNVDAKENHLGEYLDY